MLAEKLRSLKILKLSRRGNLNVYYKVYNFAGKFNHYLPVPSSVSRRNWIFFMFSLKMA